MMSTKRWVLVGATSAVVLVALVVGVLAIRGNTGPGGASSTPTKVVVVFAMADEDRTVTAQMVAVVDPSSGSYELQETSATVSIPGTSYSLLRDAYPFGGAKAVAAAIDGGELKSGTAWVDVSQEAWERLLAAGVDVTITVPFDTFDEVTERYTAFEVGGKHVEAADLWALVNGVSYLDAQPRRTIMEALAAASLRQLGKAEPTRGVETVLTAAQWAAFAQGLAGN